MNERLRLLREKIGISRAVFGQRIGVSGDVINNLERGRVEIKEHILKLICSEFSANEDWLRTGTGEMFLKTSSDTMEQLKKEFDLDEFSFKLVYGYLKLAPAERKAIRDLFYRVIESEENIFNAVETIQTTERNQNQKTTEELEEEYKKSRLNSARKTTPFVSNTIKENTENEKKNA